MVFRLFSLTEGEKSAYFLRDRLFDKQVLLRLYINKEDRKSNE